MSEAADYLEFVHRVWPAHPRWLGAIRAEARRWLTPLALPDDAEQDIVLAVSEAASNAVEHAYTPAAADDTVELTFWIESQALSIEIIDHGRWRPPSYRPEERGRGLLIMQNLIESVLIHYDPHGTRVLLRQPLPAETLGRFTPASAVESSTPTDRS